MSAIRNVIADAASLEEIRDRIPDIYDKLKGKTFTKAIEQSRTLAQLAGMAEVEDEGDREDAPFSPFRLPFKEAIEYFRKKVIIPSDRWNKFTSEMHEFAFTVTGITKGQILEDVKWLVDKAISQGDDIDTFKKQFRRLIGRKGWQPDDRRIYTILDTNSRRAYAAGRYQQVMEPDMLERRPYLVWKHRDSVVPRPNHLALDNKAIPAKHPFWKVAFPTCAWGCRCSAVSANARMLERIGAQILNNPPDPKTIADPGFQIAPGSLPEEERQNILNDALAKLSPEIREKVSREIQK